MKSLIRFEDTYGLCDIYCKIKGIPYENIENAGKILSITDKQFIEFGLGARCFKLNNDEIDTIIFYDIHELYIVYDLDNEKGNKTKILSEERIIKSYNKIKEEIEKIKAGYELNIMYIPVTWAAETILLYQYIINGDAEDDEEDAIENHISTVDTNNLHLYLIGYFSNSRGLKSAKQVRSYLDINKLLNHLKEGVSQENLNYNLSNILQNNFDASQAFNITQALNHRNKAEEIFNKYRELNKGGHITITKTSGEETVIPYDATKQQLEELLPFKD